MKKSNQTIALILCAGEGKRMKSELPKVMHKIGGLPLIGHVLSALKLVGEVDRVACVIAPSQEQVRDFVFPIPCFVQEKQCGTAHAVLAATSFIEESLEGVLLVLYGDTPLLNSQTLESLLKKHHTSGAAVTLLGMRVSPPNNYGRIIESSDGECERIVEALDATPEELQTRLCNSGAMVLDLKWALCFLKEIKCDNLKGEYYLTDVIHLARCKGLKVTVYEAPLEEVLGVNTKEDLSIAEKSFQTGMRKKNLNAGVTLLDPESVYFSVDTKIAPDVIIEPHVFFGLGVEIGSHTRIRSYSYIEGAIVDEYVEIGPFARLRPGTLIQEKAKVGNFVEVKKSVLSKGVKVNHLSYIGDTFIGENANIGAGTITCNYDGFTKHQTEIGAGSFIGSNTALIAPLKIGKNVLVGAGSVIIQDVTDDAIALSRAPQKQIPEGSKRFRSRAKKLLKE